MSKSDTLLILGAGASYNCFPTVADMKKHIPVFISILNAIKDKPLLNIVIKDLQYIVEALDVVPTPDAAIQSTFLHRRNEYYSLLKSYWIYLNMLQYANRSQIGLITMNVGRSYSYYDIRYGDFLLQHFIPNPDKFTILSWNYDINFELSYQYLKGYRNTEESFVAIPSFPRPTVNNDYEVKPRLYHLNGSSAFYEHQGKYQSLHPRMANREIKLGMERDVLLDELLWIHDNMRTREVSILDTLKFVFSQSDKEKRRMGDIIIEECSGIKKTVFIGYSFPYTNKETDAFIFQELPNDCEIVIQNPIRLKELVVDRFGIEKSRITEIHEEERMNEFVVY